MKRIYGYISSFLSVAVLAFVLAACTSDPIPVLDAGAVPVASDYENDIVIDVNQETNYVTFSFTGKGCTPVWILDDGTTYSSSMVYTKFYRKAGDYSVDIRFSNANGMSDGYLTRVFTLENTKMTGFSGFVYDSPYNLWTAAETQIGEPWYWYAPGWNQIADPNWLLNGSTYTVSLPEATTDQWQAQMHIQTNIVTTEDTAYDFSIILSSNTDHPGVTVKLTNSDDSAALIDEKVALQAGEPKVFWKADVPGVNLDGVKFVFDFGGNAEGAQISLGDIVLKDHANDDGTVIPSEPVVDDSQEEVIWHNDEEHNFWLTASYENSFYYAPGWSPIADPVIRENNGAYTIVLPEATTDQWQAQVHYHTNMSTTSATSYDFRCTFISTTDVPNVTVKLTDETDDNNFYFTENVSLVAGVEYTFTRTHMPGIDIAALNLVFDFGGNPEDTEVTVSDIIFQEYSPISFDEDADTNLWKGSSIDMSFYYAPGWSQIADPVVRENGGNYTIVLPEATFEQWQAQVFFDTNIATSAADIYDFRCIFNSTQDVKGVTVKLTKSGDDNTFYFTENIDLVAGVEYVFKSTSMPGIDMEAVKLVLDFGGNPADTEVTVGGIILQVR